MTVVAKDEFVHPNPLVMLTVYVPPVVTVMLEEVAPLFQLYCVFPDGALNTTLLPWQKASGPLAVTLFVGRGLTVTETGAEVLTHPLLVVVTV